MSLLTNGEWGAMCPFCGKTDGCASYYEEGVVIVCLNCGAEGPDAGGTVEDAWRLWNRRAYEVQA